MTVELRCAFGSYGHTAAIIDGELSISGFELNCVQNGSIVSAYREMARSASFDVCEMGPVSYLAARAAGTPLIALPIFTFRRFHHGAVVCRADSAISGPADLESQAVGVRAYSVTSAVWARGLWSHDYGANLSKISWLTDDEENADSLSLPANVRRVADGDSVRAAFARGDAVASFTGVAGLGRTGPPSGSWATGAAAGDIGDTRELIANWQEAEADWYARTGIYPLHGMVVMRAETADRHPELPSALLEVFDTSKRDYLSRFDPAEDEPLARNMTIVGPDPLPYGLEQNKLSIEALLKNSVEQGLAPSDQSIGELFLDVTI